MFRFNIFISHRISVGQSFPPSTDLHRLSSGAEDDYRSGSAEGHNGGGDVDDVWEHKPNLVKFQDNGEEDEDLDREVRFDFSRYIS